MSLFHCGYCDAPIPHTAATYDRDFDEGEPRRYDGMPACFACREQFAREDGRPRVHTDAAVLAMSQVCWWCTAGTPVEVRQGKPTCEACERAFTENVPRPALDLEAP